MITGNDIRTIFTATTKKWTKQRKAEERSSRSRSYRGYIYSDRVSFTDVAESILPGGYDHASGGGQFPVSNRQFYYACREEFKERTGRPLNANYFSSTLLRKYMNRHPETASWKVTADPRGTLTIPKGGQKVRIPCGTLQIAAHLHHAHQAIDALAIDASLPTEWPSLRAGERYQAVLYIEKEGFEPLLEEARIAELFDLAILSCKGQSVVAARRLVDEVCDELGGVPLFVIHDFDKAGFEISQCLTTVSDWAEDNDRVAYRFQNTINVTDLGLRLADVEEYDLGEETCEFNGHFRPDSIATPEEQEFLRSGRRVELNAFTSPQFIEWLEAKLTEQGLDKRLIPADDVLEDAYRRAMAVASINNAIEDMVDDIIAEASEATIPKTLKRRLHKAMKDSQDDAWDVALYRLIEREFKGGEDE